MKLEKALKIIWNNIPQSKINDLILSMDKRVIELAKNKGFSTHY